MVPSYPSSSEKRSEEIAAGLKKQDGTVDQVDEGRKLFAHFLWSAAMVVAEGVEEADMPIVEGEMESWKVRLGGKRGRFGEFAGRVFLNWVLVSVSTPSPFFGIQYKSM